MSQHGDAGGVMNTDLMTVFIREGRWRRSRVAARNTTQMQMVFQEMIAAAMTAAPRMPAEAVYTRARSSCQSIRLSATVMASG